MTPPAERPDRRLSTALAGLHRALLNAQAVGRPQASSPYTLLQMLMHDPDFAWLRAFSDLMLRIDEAGAKGSTPSPEAIQGFLTAASSLVEGDGQSPESGSHARLVALQTHPEVAAHTATMRTTLLALRQELAQ